MTAPRPWLSCGRTVRTRRTMHRAQLCRTRRADREPQSVPRETRPLTRSRRESVAERAADSGNWVEECTAVVALPAAPSLIGTPTPVSPPARRTPTETPRSEDPPATHEARTSADTKCPERQSQLRRDAERCHVRYRPARQAPTEPAASGPPWNPGPRTTSGTGDLSHVINAHELATSVRRHERKSSPPQGRTPTDDAVSAGYRCGTPTAHRSTSNHLTRELRHGGSQRRSQGDTSFVPYGHPGPAE